MAIVTKKTTRGVRKPTDDAVLASYLKEINKIPLLTHEEEKDLARRAAAGDEQAKDRLIRSNLRFVVTVAKKYQNQGMPLTDLISEGNVGLINAIERYDVERGYHFISYAVWWIRQAILKALSQTTRIIRLPLNRVDELSKIQRTRRELMGDHGELPSNAEVARALNMREETVADLLAVSRPHVSLDAPLTSEKDSDNIGDLVQDESAESPEATAMNSAVADEIEEALSDLSEREAEVIRYRFGLGGRRPLTLREIGDMYDLSKERIRQIEKNALTRLKASDKASKLRSLVA